MKRRTIARPVSLEGIGLHLGAACQLTFRPGASGAGVLFRRTDLAGRADDSSARRPRGARPSVTRSSARIRSRVHTVEHVLAAVVGCGIDDLEIDLNAGEPPIMDGSGAPFVDALVAAGIVEHAGEVKYLTIRAPMTFTDGESTYEVVPSPDLELDVTIDFPHAMIGRQRGCYRVTPETFRAGSRSGPNVWIRPRGGIAAREGTDSGRVARQRDRSRREWSDRRDRFDGPTSSCGTKRSTVLETSRWPVRGCERR